MWTNNVKVLNLILLLAMTKAFMVNKDDKCFAAVPSGIFILAITFAAIINKESHSIISQGRCEPFRGYFVWDQCKDENDFNVQRHYMIKVMDNATRGTHFSLKTGNQLVTVIRNGSKSVSQKVIKVKFDISQDNVISYTSLRKNFSNKILQTENEAFGLFFFVNKNSKIDDEETAIKELKKNKVFVVYYGQGNIPNFWKSLATDNNHLLHLEDNINDKFLAFLNVICHDSRLYCDNDNYWRGTECFRCSFICTQLPSEYCKQECPLNVLATLVVIGILKWKDIRRILKNDQKERNNRNVQLNNNNNSENIEREGSYNEQTRTKEIG